MNADLRGKTIRVIATFTVIAFSILGGVGLVVMAAVRLA